MKHEVAEDRARAILASAEISSEQERSGWAAITDVALNICGQPDEGSRGWEEARELSRVPLEAVGAIPYEPHQPRGMWGR